MWYGNSNLIVGRHIQSCHFRWIHTGWLKIIYKIKCMFWETLKKKPNQVISDLHFNVWNDVFDRLLPAPNVDPNFSSRTSLPKFSLSSILSSWNVSLRLSHLTTTKKAALCSWSSSSCNLLFWFWVLSRLPTSRVQNAPHSHYTRRIKCKIVRRTTVDDDDAVMKSHFVANIWNGTFTNQIITSLFCRDKLNRFFPQVWWLFCIDLFPIIVVDCPWRYGY